MDWANERYVRLYVRDTLTWKLIGHEGRCTLLLLLRKLDRAGVFDIGESDPVDAVAAIIESPAEFTRIGLGRLLKRGVVELGTGQIVMPNYLDAQEAEQSGPQRNREWRARRRDKARLDQRDATSRSRNDPTQRDHSHGDGRDTERDDPSRVRDATSRESDATSRNRDSEPSKPSVLPLRAASQPAGSRPVRSGGREAKTTAPWASYSAAFEARWRVKPPRSAKTNALLAQVVDGVGETEAPLVVGYYVRQCAGMYATAKHPLNLLVRDLVKIRTEWALARNGAPGTTRRLHV